MTTRGDSYAFPLCDMTHRRVADSLGVGAVCTLAHRIAAVDSSFRRSAFLSRALAGLDGLPLFGRADHIAECLRRSLPASLPRALRILVDVLDAPRKSPGYGAIENFWVLPLTRFVGHFGLAHFNESMEALYQMTRRFTSEFDVRPFLMRHPSRTLSVMRVWSQDSDLHVRRLVSEGTRPRLPWSRHLEQFKRDPRPVIELLEFLKDDPEVYVRRSVANNLADIIKDNPDLAYPVLQGWSCSASPARVWLIRHAIRFPCARNDSRALELLESLR